MQEQQKSTGFISGLLGAMGMGAVVAPFAVPRYGWIVALVLLLVLAVGICAWILIRRGLRNKRAQGLGEGIASSSSMGAGSAEEKARRDELRRKFMRGIEEYRKRGKDLYTVPWFMMVGLPGSGKTEAIRHSSMGFPASLTDEFQGTGGTRSMDWWFTNNGVILDTAGRYTSEEGDSAEWKEFLHLIKKWRPNCPINGLFIAVDAGFLLRGEMEEIRQHARQLARKLETVQLELDVRFPVYLLLTKCDLVTGFNEFFTAVEDREAQGQIVGWSNQDPLDVPFRVDAVESFLQDFVEKLRKASLPLLKESSPWEEYRRSDPMTSVNLYALPQSLSLAMPKILCLVKTIFAQGDAFAAKPVFFRGIYFTSALCTGEQVDVLYEELIRKTGAKRGEPQKKGSSERGEEVFTRKYGLFLRDLFLEKAFRERGLVTAATDTKRMLRNRQLAILGTGGVAMALFVVFSWIGWKQLQDNVRRESAYWEIATNSWSTGVWLPIVDPVPGSANAFRFNGASEVPNARGTSLLAFHESLRGIVAEPLRVSWIFKPIQWLRPSRDLNRQESQRLLLESSLVGPLLEAARTRMHLLDTNTLQRAGDDGTVSERQRKALLALVEIEARIAQAQALDSAKGQEQLKRLVQPLFNFVLETNGFPVPDAYLQVVAASFSGTGRDSIWPPPRFSGGRSLATNSALNKGLAYFLATSATAQESIREQLDRVVQSARFAANFHRIEREMWEQARKDGVINPDQLGKLSEAKETLDKMVKSLSEGNGISPITFTLDSMHTSLFRKAGLSSSNTVEELHRVLIPVLKNPDYPLFDELLSRSKSATGELVREVAEMRRMLDSRTDAPKFAELDAILFAAPGGTNLYQLRWELYRKSDGIARLNPAELLGTEFRFLADIQQRKNELEAERAKYNVAWAWSSQLGEIVSKLGTENERNLREKLINDYVRVADEGLNLYGSLTADKMTYENFKAAGMLFAKLTKDLTDKSLAAAEFNIAQRGSMRRLRDKLDTIQPDVLKNFQSNLWNRSVLAVEKLRFDSIPRTSPMKDFRKYYQERLAEEIQTPEARFFTRNDDAVLLSGLDELRAKVIRKFLENFREVLTSGSAYRSTRGKLYTQVAEFELLLEEARALSLDESIKWFPQEPFLEFTKTLGTFEQRAVDGYCANAITLIKERSGFPLIWDSRVNSTPASLGTLKGSLDEIEGDLRKALMARTGSAAKARVELVITRLKPVLLIILQPDGTVGKFSLSVEQMNPATLRIVQVIANRNGAGKTLDPGNAGVFGEYLLDQPLMIKAYVFGLNEDPILTRELAEWPGFSLIKGNGVQRQPEGRTWSVPFGTSKGEFRLKLDFKVSLPKLEEWPTQGLLE